ncbi:hypothetical protein [Levilactobacillus tujiorum]|uniref:Uncharacterized protein n=1 Tax=Levilactobacillus tujiorum TaxID=2912243 RepID=A0ABX1L7W1_9LACO|nr:hypothetical protein [Levilactobacillus tujiorum]MCH5464078.1 hypothetical protein [Levilactobacillus tujiorum]NLR11178.1 hypothetical protein [Lactobacillus sp. HBUAS51387]NLR29195.1 hypothetical protein [Levilactobacillus tujiorum]
MSKKKSFSKSYIASINNVNRDLPKFFEWMKEFASEVDLTLDSQNKVKRCLELLRASDALISDQGIRNIQGSKLLQQLQQHPLNEENSNIARKLLRDTHLLIELRCKLVHKGKLRMGDFEDPIGRINGLYKVCQDVLSEKDREYSLENVIEEVSMLVKQVLADPAREVGDLITDHHLRSHGYDNIDSIYYFNVMAWKYVNAKLSVDQQTNEIVIDSATPQVLDYRLSNYIGQAESEKVFKLRMRNHRGVGRSSDKIDIKPDLKFDMLYSLSDYLFDEGHELSDYTTSKKSYREFEKEFSWSRKLLFGLPLRKWIRFLADLKATISLQEIKAAIKRIDWRKFPYLNKEEINLFQRELSIKPGRSAGLYEAPLIVENGSTFVFVPAIYEWDPSYTLKVVMGRRNSAKDDAGNSDPWLDLRGENFQLTVNKWLEDSGVTDYEHEIKRNDAGKNEVDIIVNGRDGCPIILELKVLTVAHDIKEYRLQQDKLISLEYATHAHHNWDYFLSGDGDDRLKHHYDWSKATTALVTNLYLTAADRDRFKLNIVHQFELYRLLNDKPLNSLKVNGTISQPVNIRTSVDSSQQLTGDNIRALSRDRVLEQIFNNSQFKNAGNIGGNGIGIRGQLKSNGFIDRCRTDYWHIFRTISYY